MPFTLAGRAQVEGVSDGFGLGRVGMFRALAVELELAPFDDSGVAAVASWREAEAGDLVEEVGQEAVDKKGEAS
jgi:hypothetical protein